MVLKSVYNEGTNNNKKYILVHHFVT